MLEKSHRYCGNQGQRAISKHQPVSRRRLARAVVKANRASLALCCHLHMFRCRFCLRPLSAFAEFGSSELGSPPNNLQARAWEFLPIDLAE